MDLVQVIGVDNVLNRLLDPVQVYFTASKQLETSLKCLVKRSPDEKVGVVCKKNNKYDVVEYSELSDEQAKMKAPDGNSLYFELGHILIFMLNSKKLLELCSDTDKLNQLYHVAHKKVETWNNKEKKAVKPSSNNAYKFELFMHNFLPFCQSGKFGALKVQREEEFGPVKNADQADGSIGVDTPMSAKMLLLNQHNKWVQHQCPPAQKESVGKMETEVDLLLSYEGEGEEFKKCCQNIQSLQKDAKEGENA